MAKKAQTKELARKETTDVSTVPSELAAPVDVQSSVGDVRAGDFIMPFLLIIQPLSPQKAKNNAKFIKGAQEGDIFNTATQALAKEVYFVLSWINKVFIEWKPRSKGGGFVGIHDRDSELAMDHPRDAETNRIVLPNGNELVDHGQLFITTIDRETGRPDKVLLSLKGSQMRKFRAFNTDLVSRINSMRTSKHGLVFKLSTCEESNDKGQWYGIYIEFVGTSFQTFPNKWHDIYQASRELEAAVCGGRAKTEYTVEADTEL